MRSTASCTAAAGALMIPAHLNPRLAGCLGVVLVLWDIKAVFYTVWWPLKWMLSYVDPRKGADQDPLYGECKRACNYMPLAA